MASWTCGAYGAIGVDKNFGTNDIKRCALHERQILRD